MASVRTVLVVGTAAAADALDETAPSLVVRHVGEGTAVVDRLDEGPVDCVVTGHDPPAVDAPSVVRTAVDRGVPVLVATGDGSETLAGDVVAAGATGYVPTEPATASDTLVERVLSATETGPDREREQYRTIMETVPEGIFVLDEDGVALTGNRAGARMLGCGYEELVGTQIADLVDDGVFEYSVIERYLEVVRDLLSSETDTDVGVLEFDAHPEPDETRVYEARIALRPYDESFRGVIGIIRDVTDRERRREELGRYEAIITSLGDPVWAVDPDGYGTYVNPAYEEQFGWTQAEAEAGEIHFTETIADEDVPAIRALTETLLSDDNDRQRDTLEVDVVTRDGRRVPVEDHFALLPTDGEFRGMAGVARDISDRKRRSRRIQVLNRVLRHNLGNDMNVVAGTATRIAETATDPEQVEWADRIRQRAEELVDVSRTVRRIEGVIDHDRSDLRALDVTAVLEAAVDELRWEFPDATVRVSAPSSVHAAATEGLQHAVEQVLENAVEHADAAAPTVAAVLDRRTVDDVEWVSLRVSDDGPGLPPEERAVILGEEDITPLNHGSGLGLWVVRWVIESLDGQMAIDEESEGGTVVELRLRPATPS